MSAARLEGLSEEPLYARWLGAIVVVGFVSLLASFVVYLTGAMAPGIPPEMLPRYWGLPVKEYVLATGAPTGWQWIHRLNESDLLNFAGVAMLGASTIVAYLRVLPEFLRAGRRLTAAICAAQVVVLLLAASGLLRG